MKKLVALLCGTLFGFGLALSGMTDTSKVIGFLDLFGKWDPSLAFVMAGAVLVTAVSYRLIFKRETPILDSQFHLPTVSDIDKPLISGAVLFGLGWGLYGYCPGPAIAALAYLDAKTFLFVASMAVGMGLMHRFNRE